MSVSRELLRLRDTNEFAHIETRPVLYSVWRNGKYVDPDEEPVEQPMAPAVVALELSPRTVPVVELSLAGGCR